MKSSMTSHLESLTHIAAILCMQCCSLLFQDSAVWAHLLPTLQLPLMHGGCSKRGLLMPCLSLTRETPSSAPWGYVSVRTNDDWTLNGSIHLQYVDRKLVFSLLGAEPARQEFEYTQAAGVAQDMELVYDKVARTVALFVGSELKETKMYRMAITARIRPGYVGCYLGADRVFQGVQCWYLSTSPVVLSSD